MEIQKSPIEVACEAVGSQAEMARLLEISPGMVNQWVKGVRPVPVEYCKAIERLTCGQVTVQSLYPKGWQKIWPELIKGKRAKPWGSITEHRTFVRRADDRATHKAPKQAVEGV